MYVVSLGTYTLCQGYISIYAALRRSSGDHSYVSLGAYEMRLCALEFECNWPVVLSTFLRHATHVTLLPLGETWSLGRQFMILT